MNHASDTHLAWRLALRDLLAGARDGFRGFRILILCLALGVASITGVATLRGAIESGLADEGAVILGGDAEMQFTYRRADSDERAFMEGVASRISEVITFRSMLAAGAAETQLQALTEVKAVDHAWPLLGRAELIPEMTLETAFAGKDGLPGIVLAPLLLERLETGLGQRVTLGGQPFVVMATLASEPDSSGGGFALGPRALVRSAALEGSGLIGPGTLFESHYRLRLPPEVRLGPLEDKARATFAEKGLRWKDRRNAAPAVERFVRQISAFLILVGLAGLAVGGVGIAAALRSWLDGRTRSIATLRVLGASSRLILASHLLQVAALGGIGIVIGLVLGAGLPMLGARAIEAALPFPAQLGLSGRALAEGAFYGAMTMLIFAALPLARLERVRSATLYREGAGATGWPGAGWLLVLGLGLALTVGVAAFTSPQPLLALGVTVGVVLVLGLLVLAAMLLRLCARKLSRARLVHGKPGLRAALGAVGARGSEAVPVVLALGLGLSVLSAVGQVDGNIRSAIATELPKRAPAFFLVDIQPDQIGPLTESIAADPELGEFRSAPMLRGVLSRINDRPAREVAPGHWVVRGDRGISSAAAMPEGTRLVAGKWWPEDYQGPPLVSVSRKEADEIGLKLGDQLTLNILGRDITATIASLREVDFRSGGMGFVMVLNASALAGAPHSHIATLVAPPEAEARVLRMITTPFPNITAISVREAVEQASAALGKVATATALAAGGTLLTGLAVVIGAAAAGQSARAREAALMKVLGASRRRILISLALRHALIGAAAGLVAVGAGTLASWVVMRAVMEAPWQFMALPALSVVGGGLMATLLAGLFFARKPLRQRPAGVLRAEE